jgi:phosphoribosylformimino-5-aminoimidazole carboxamide ribotide isomerase
VTIQSHPRLIPVLDIKDGRVVHAVGGTRENYQPLACPYTGSHQPVDIARALLQMAGANELYIADLDAIMGRPRVSRGVLSLMEMCREPTWLDAGIGHKLTVNELPNLPHVHPIVGFETCFKPQALEAALAQAGEPPLAFSIDLKDGRLIGNWRNWELDDDRDALGLARRVVAMGAQTLIVLDLARVGTGTGTGTEPLLKAIRKELPDIELIAGGGIRSLADVEILGRCGADAVLIASALHDGGLISPPARI